MTIYETSPPPYTPPPSASNKSTTDINNFLNNVQSSVPVKRERTDNNTYQDYDNPERDTKRSRSLSRTSHIDYRDTRNDYSSTPSNNPLKSNTPCWYKVNGFECILPANRCHYSHNHEIIKRYKSYRVPELCLNGKGCQAKCKKYHSMYEYQNELRYCIECNNRYERQLQSNDREIKIRDTKIFSQQKRIYDLEDECNHWRNKYDQALKDLDVSNRRSSVFETIANNYKALSKF